MVRVCMDESFRGEIEEEQRMDDRTGDIPLDGARKNECRAWGEAGTWSWIR